MLTEKDFTTFVRHPYTVSAVQITAENIEDLAKKLGKLKVNPETDEPFIQLNFKVVPHVHKAHIGWWVSSFRGDIRCFSDDVFQEQFSTLPEHGVFSYGFDMPLPEPKLRKLIGR